MAMRGYQLHYIILNVSIPCIIHDKTMEAVSKEYDVLFPLPSAFSLIEPLFMPPLTHWLVSFPFFLLTSSHFDAHNALFTR
jgi:hypothetical protein